MLISHMHSQCIPAMTNIVADETRHHFLGFSNVLGLYMILDIVTIGARIITQATTENSTVGTEHIGIYECIQCFICSTQTCGRKILHFLIFDQRTNKQTHCRLVTTSKISIL